MRASVSRVYLCVSWAWLCQTVEPFQALACIAEMCQRRWAPPTLGVTFDFGHVPVLAWEESREQAVSVNEVDYLGGLGRTVRLRDRLQGGERWVNVWRLCGCSPAGM